MYYKLGIWKILYMSLEFCFGVVLKLICRVIEGNGRELCLKIEFLVLFLINKFGRLGSMI